MVKRLQNLMGSLKASGALAIAAGFVVAMALMDMSRSLVGGMLGFLLERINVQNEGQTFRLELGTILLAALSAAVALGILFLLLGSREGAEREPG